MKQWIITASHAVDAAIKRIAMAVLLALVAVVLLQVLARYVLFQPPVWTEELSRYLMIWAGLLGATLAFKRAFDPTLFPARAIGGLGPWLRSIAVLLWVLPTLFYSLFGPGMRWHRGYLMRHAHTYSETMDFPTLVVAAAVPIALLIILLHLAARWAGDSAAAGEGEHA